MGMKKTAGFTIIEVMLVLAITGLMLVGILVGASAQINRQEYRSSVTNLQSEIQQQYSVVQNPSNDRPAASDICNKPAVSRGTSDSCFLVGRLLTSDGAKLTETPVIGQNTADSQEDITSGWKLILDSDQASTYTPTWGSALSAVTSKGATKHKQFSVLVIMSPKDGSLHTYINSSSQIVSNEGLQDMLNSQQMLNICVENGLSAYVGSELAVRIDKDASNTSGIVIPTQNEGICS